MRCSRRKEALLYTTLLERRIQRIALLRALRTRGTVVAQTGVKRREVQVLFRAGERVDGAGVNQKAHVRKHEAKKETEQETNKQQQS